MGLSGAGIEAVIGSPSRTMGWRGEVPQEKVECRHREKVKVSGTWMLGRGAWLMLTADEVLFLETLQQISYKILENNHA